MTGMKRLSICYAAPGHSLLPSAGSSRNVLNLAKALSQWADVTLAFRSILGPAQGEPYRIMAFEPQPSRFVEPKDDVATRGLNPISHIAYLRTLRSFCRRQAGSYDVVLEKGWRLSGFFADAFRSQGVPGAVVENDVRCWNEPLNDWRTIGKSTLHSAAQRFAGFYSRRAALVIAETEELKSALMKERGIAEDRLEVIGLGVDHSLFRPMDPASARQSLGIRPEATVLLYVGGMDIYHDLSPLFEALTQTGPLPAELHLVGDGEFRIRYEHEARRAKIKAQFHGPVPHNRVPEYIAAADLCLAPYRTSAFHQGEVAFSTLKIPEYMACGRPVASVPSGHIKRLIEHQVTGFLLPNEVSSWLSFMNALPPRQHLHDMGRAALLAAQSLSWDKTAARYLEVCRRLVAEKRSARSGLHLEVPNSE